MKKFGIGILAGIMLLTGCNGSDREKSTEILADKEVKLSQSSFSGNNMKNVEQRDYATLLLITKGSGGKRYHFDLGIAQEKRVGEKSQTEEVCGFDCNHLEELSEAYQLVKGKDLSLSHLKVILFGETGEENAALKPQTLQTGNSRQVYPMEELQEILFLLDENKEIAKTCPVLQLTEQDAFLRYMEKSEEPVGTYVSSLVEAGEKQGGDIPWLKDYLKAVREGDELMLYYLESVSEGWMLKCGAVWQG
ncbi:MAG: hypothetical protein NC348_13950 [Clostridium sp.]|nr:hypothetical protein [Clostridium sp.]